MAATAETAPDATEQTAPRPDIEQDYELNDDDGTIGNAMAVFWAKGHGYDEREFIRAVVDYCLDNDVDIPRITGDDGPTEMWQQNVHRYDGIEYRRTSEAPDSPRSPKFPITVLDLEGVRRHGGTKCSIRDCKEPWSVGQSVRVVVGPDDGHAELGRGRQIAAELWLCREHRTELPEPSYRVFMVPVGATILLPGQSETV